MAGDDPDPLRHRVTEPPPVRPVVDEYRLHRLACPRCRTPTRAKLPPGYPAGRPAHGCGPSSASWPGPTARASGRSAKRALRHGVIYRKLSGGTDSEAGSRFVERMLSVAATCRQQGVEVLDYLSRCYRAVLDGRPAPSLLPAASNAQPA